MLRQLVIHDVVLIDRLALEFEPGLGVLTGETGAGKSILLDALGLAMGNRADAALVRSGQSAASVSAEIELPEDHAALALLAEQGIAREAGEPLILRRSLKADGGSRAFAGAASVPASLLRDAAALAIEVHGQHDDRGLLNPRGHRALLDAFGRLDLAPVEAAWGEVERIEAELAEARALADNAERDRDYLAHAAAEIAALDPEPGEETQLADERAAMQAGAKAGESLTGLDELLGGADGALASLAARGPADRARRRRPSAAGRGTGVARPGGDRGQRGRGPYRPRRRRLGVRSGPAGGGRGAAVRHSRRWPASIASRPMRWRRWASEMQAKLQAIEAGGERIAELERALGEARGRYDAAAATCASSARLAAERLDAKVAGELAPLKLDSARFRTALSDAEPGPKGMDRIEFEVSTNPGAPFGPLTRIASGGELSRFILALKVALAEAGNAGTMIFDEVDRGVGGAVASAIGERLARLAEDAQVLVVTHQPAGGGARRASLPDREEPRRRGHADDGAQAVA